MDKDDEVKGAGNNYTSEYRAYDPRLSRWFSLDSAMRSNMSMYVGFSNNPIIKVDPRGDDDFFDRTGHFIYSTTVGNNIRVIENSVESFKIVVINGTPIITAALKDNKSRNEAMNIYLESYSTPLSAVPLWADSQYDQNLILEGGQNKGS